MRAALGEGTEYGRARMGGGKVNIEYVSANPTGPMHVGHGRGAVFGDALANLLVAAGPRRDARSTTSTMPARRSTCSPRSAFLRYREALGEEVGPVPEGLYPGDYLVPVGKALAEKHGRALLDAPESDWLPQVRADAIAAMMDLIRGDLARLGIHHDVFFSEATLKEAVPVLLAELRAKGLVYEGRLPPPKGQLPEDWETASRPCSARWSSATTSTGRC